MNKRRDALRRGVRALIFNTSRELAVLEGRPLPAEAESSRLPLESPPPPAAAPSDASTEPDERASVDATRTEEPPPSRPAPRVPPVDAPPIDPRAVEGQARQTPAVVDAPQPVRPVPPTPRFTLTPLPEDGRAGGDGRPAKAAPPPKAALPPKAASPPKATLSPKAARPGKAARVSKTAHPAKTTHPPRSSASLKALRKARRPRQRLLPDIPVDGADPHQAFSRTGVCFAYFVNNACWRVRDAYCNTALHMCIIRNCPVYHLHKEALERRFARKFAHLW